MAIAATGLTPLLHVADMERALAFYRDRLGFAVVHAHPAAGRPAWAMLRLGGATLMLNDRDEDDSEAPAIAAPALAAAHGDVILYVACPDVDAAWAELRAAGCATQPPADTFYGMRQLHLRDPDGFGICFQAPVPG